MKLVLTVVCYGCRSEAESADAKDEEQAMSTVRPEEIPAIPENRFLMRRSPQQVQQQKEEAGKEREKKREKPRER